MPEFTPLEVEVFRTQTERQKPMAGIMSPSFKCVVCKINKKTKGRKAVLRGSSKAGYKCADCVSKEVTNARVRP